MMPICKKTVSIVSDEGRRVGLKRTAGHLALSRLDDAGAVGTNETGLVLAHQRVLHTNPAYMVTCGGMQGTASGAYMSC
jgi:hypothetical protein